MTSARAGAPQDLRPGVDAVDRALLRLLARDARTTNQALADAVGIAPSTCLARVRALRERGVVRGFHADVDPAAVGLPLQAMISLRLHSDARDRMEQLSNRLTALPSLREVFFVAGEDDYLLHVAVADSAALRDLVTTLNALPEVAGTNTSLIFEHRSLFPG
ncbi:Lrp/AsnC family transcriptional regulator [Rhodococcus aerolatus]